MELEQWKPCPGFEGLYEVSDHGSVRRIAAGHASPAGKILKGCVDKKTGYDRVTLCRSDKKHTRSVHRLVALAFVPNPHGYPEVHHVDDDKTNNRADNFEWLSKVGHRALSFGEKGRNVKLTESQAIELKSLYIPGRNGNGGMLAQQYGICVPTVCNIAAGRRWKHLDLGKKPPVSVSMEGSEPQEAI